MGLKELSAYQLPAYSLYAEQWCKDKEGFFDFHVFNYHKNLFFAKHSDWRDENEYRWIIRSRGGNTPFIDISKALVKVIVGHEIKEPNLRNVIVRCKSMNTPVHKVVWNASGGLTDDLTRDVDDERLNIDSAFSQTVMCEAVIFRITNTIGEPRVMMLASASGSGYDCRDGSDLRPWLEHLGEENEEVTDAICKGFSAGRMAEVIDRPFKVIQGVLSFEGGEEVPYYSAR